MTTERKHNEVTLKTKYEALKEFEKIDLTKKLPFRLTFLEVHFLLEPANFDHCLLNRLFLDFLNNLQG